MKIALASSEAVPFAKTGGLGDVVGALFREFWQQGHEVTLFLPLYGGIRKTFGMHLHPACEPFSVPIGGDQKPCQVFVLTKLPFTSHAGRKPERQVGRVLFISNDFYYDRDDYYGTAAGAYPDNDARFIFFCKAIMEASRCMQLHFDVLHCHDWQTALTPLMMKEWCKNDHLFAETRTVFTIHNLGYQGIFPEQTLDFIGLDRRWFTMEGIEFYGQVNFLKAALISADVLTTVSPTYAREILTADFGFGLDGVLRKRRDDLYGILNGLDYSQWTPYADPHLPSRFSSSHLAGRAWCRRHLIKEHNLEDGLLRPLLGFVGRLVDQKGVDVLAQAIPGLIALGANIAIVGKGDPALQEMLRDLFRHYPGRMILHLGFDETLAHRIYATADLFLMPSRYEPCGLAQLIAMRYGAIPVARRTGGLADTIDHGRTGFLFNECSADALIAGVKEALAVRSDAKAWRRMIHAAMDEDFSWTRSADQYLRLFRDGSL
jgi:starch synthase